MNAVTAEIVGTALLILFGDGVVANIALSKSKGNGAGFLAVTIGWAMAVFIGVYVSAPYSGGHLNPAVTIALAYAGKFSWADVPMYIGAQFIGAMIGATLVWLAYKQHFDATEDASTKLGVFCNAPAIRSTSFNLLTEIIATFAFMMGVLFITKSSSSLGALDALPVALLVWGIGLCMGGPTGYAINPARDMGPRLMHFLLPIKNKGGSDWNYSWIPVAGPVIGALIAAAVYNLILQ